MGLKEYGFHGFLIGENFMKEENPGEACQDFINHIR
jgi:indole-3-glycerol phosphate synthase